MKKLEISKIIIFGQKFINNISESNKDKMWMAEEDKEIRKEFKKTIQKYFKNFIWITYRSNFQPLPGNITTDSGWGCMIRAGQMLIANLLIRHVFHSFNYFDQIDGSQTIREKYINILIQ